MRSRILPKILIVVLAFITLLTAGGVYATWTYGGEINDVNSDINLDLMDFYYPPVYITAVSKKSGNGSLTVNKYYDTHLDSKITLINNASSSVTLTITVHNRTNETYAFNAVKYLTENYSNANIVYSLPVLKHGDKIAPESDLTFDVTFSFKAGASRANLVLDSILNYEFVLLSELPEEEVIAVSGALEQFKNIINNVVRRTSYNEFITQMEANDKNNRFTPDYIGNVDDASPGDKALLNDLFEGNLKLTINGKEEKVTVLIKKKNVDNNVNTGDQDGNELVIYLTTDGLTSMFGRATVYAAVFTSETAGNSWYQYGNMYTGRARIKGYNGNVFGTGSFDTEEWSSYGDSTVANGLSIEQIIANL